VPEAALLPTHAPEATQPVAFVDDHVSVVRAPAATEVGLAVNVTVGAGVVPPVRIEIAAFRVVVPPVPVQANVNVTAAAIEPMLWLPDVALLPAQPPIPPLPVQLVALLVVQVKEVDPPMATDVGFAVKVTVGAGVAPAIEIVTDLVVEPPDVFVHVSVRVVVAARGPMARFVPVKARVPFHAAMLGLDEPVQASAVVADQVTCVVPCAATEVGLAERLTEG
jgi:hypothetical protein